MTKARTLIENILKRKLYSFVGQTRSRTGNVFRSTVVYAAAVPCILTCGFSKRIITCYQARAEGSRHAGQETSLASLRSNLRCAGVNVLYWRKYFRHCWDCCNLSVGVALNARLTTNGMCAKNNTNIFVARPSNKEWARRVISIVACCHSVKLCALTARAFRSQQYLIIFVDLCIFLPFQISSPSFYFSCTSPSAHLPRFIRLFILHFPLFYIHSIHHKSFYVFIFLSAFNSIMLALVVSVPL